ncbi:MAG: type IV toxin-antitoxin system AbiEi family antitoxin [Vicinamibacterales bacterium]
MARAIAVLQAVLPRGAQLEMSDHELVVLAGRELAVRWAGAGSLADARACVGLDPTPDVVAARRLSPGARALLSDAGIGWVDESGAADIAVGTIVISRTGRPTAERERTPRWTTSTEAVAEALLCGVRPTVSATSDATSLSVGACTNALRTLTTLGFLDAGAARGRDSGRRIRDRRALLDAYAYATAARREPREPALQVGVTWRTIDAGLETLAATLNDNDIAWALSGAAAADHYAPHLSGYSAADVYVDRHTAAELEAVARACGLRPIDGGRLTLKPFPTLTTRHCAVDAGAIRLAPWPRVFVDLLDIGVRGEDAAEHLWETIGART